MEGLANYLMDEYSTLERELESDLEKRQNMHRREQRVSLRKQMDEIYAGRGDTYPTFSVALCTSEHFVCAMQQQLEKELFALIEPVAIKEFVVTPTFPIACLLGEKYGIPWYRTRETLDNEVDLLKGEITTDFIREENARLVDAADYIIITSPSDWATQDVLQRGRLLGKKVILLDLEVEGACRKPDDRNNM